MVWGGALLPRAANGPIGQRSGWQENSAGFAPMSMRGGNAHSKLGIASQKIFNVLNGTVAFSFACFSGLHSFFGHITPP